MKRKTYHDLKDKNLTQNQQIEIINDAMEERPYMPVKNPGLHILWVLIIALVPGCFVCLILYLLGVMQ